MGAAFIIAPLLVGVLLLCGFAVWQLFGLWVQDKLISGLEFFIIVSVFLSLLGMALAVGGAVSFLLVLMLAVLGAMIPLLPVVAQRVGRRQLELQDIAKYQEALKRQPDVPYPHRKLGEIYEAHGDWDRAIEHYQAYLELYDRAPDIQRRLEYAREQRRRRDLGLRRCPVCGADARPETVRCAECGFYLWGPREIIDALTAPDMMRLWRWLIVVFLVPGVILGLVGEWVPAWSGLLLLGCSIVATIIFVYGRMTEAGS